MIKLNNLQFSPDYNNADILNKIAHILNIKTTQIISYEIFKKSVDARKKPKVNIVLTLLVELSNNLENNFLELKYQKNIKKLKFQKKQISYKPIVVGFGPAGMFCALMLSRMGLNPIIIEQGKMVDERIIDVQNFWQNRVLNEYSNAQFGEGGAGTFSDGKLTTNLNNEYCNYVINEFYKFGAPVEITYSATPHIGSDYLKNIVKNIRTEIIKNGGTFYFSHKLIDINIKNNEVNSITTLNVLNNSKIEFKSNAIFLALGHSARDTFNLLHKLNFNIIQKPFAMGVRIEQLQEDINIAQYGKNYNKCLPNANYKLVTHLPNGRSVFTFCMCPGGEVVATSSAKGEIVTNGMSEFKRDKPTCNSAILVNVTPKDFGSSHPLAGIELQKKYESLAFEIGGKNYNAPAETVGDFLNNISPKNKITSTYKPNVTFVKLKNCLPNFVYESLKLSLLEFNKKLKNFAKPENLLIGIESRSSSPITIQRNDFFESNYKGIYPIGEGAGFAGGIISSAIDGIKASESFYNNLQ